MSEEEKKAIKWLKELYDIEKDFNSSKGKEESNIIKTLLNLIEKKQKEIEELKDIKDMVQVLFDNKLPKERLILITNDHLKNTGFKYLLDNYISKDKIKEILDLAYKDNYEMVKLPNNEFMCVSDCANLLDYLKELVEENESIE